MTSPFEDTPHVGRRAAPETMLNPQSLRQKRRQLPLLGRLRDIVGGQGTYPYYAAPPEDIADDEADLRFVRQGRRRSTLIGFALRFFLALPLLILVVFGALHLLEVSVGHARTVFELNLKQYRPNWGAAGDVGDGLASYPTDATRDVIPIPCHSHNDYWRRIPLFDALNWGCTSVEADVWLFEHELYVGHTVASLTANRTFTSLYVDPLVELLDRMNIRSSLTNLEDNGTANGVFDTDPTQTLVLLVDLKTGGHATLPAVYAQLEPLRSRDYLSYRDVDGFHSRPVTVVGTGNTPFDMIAAEAHRRDIFYDAPLASMWHAEDDEPTSGGESRPPPAIDGDNFDSGNSYYASSSLIRAVGLVWRRGLSQRQLELLRGQIRGAHSRSLRVRYWDTPAWPRSLRNHVWSVLMEEGADVLNTDDLRGAAVEDWKRQHHHRLY